MNGDRVASPAASDRRATYLDEDIRLTSSKELAGWYCYGFAAEVFVVCGIGLTGSFIPITLEQLARDRGVLLSDRQTPCTSSPTSVSSNASNHSTTPAETISDIGSPSQQCVVHILGAQVNTASFAMYTFSISVLIQALVIVSMSGAADHGRHRKKMLCFFAFTGSLATMLILMVTSSSYILGALLVVIANVSFGASFVLLNSFLPLLVRNHPSLLTSRKKSSQLPNSDTPHIGEDLDNDYNNELSDSTSALLEEEQSRTGHSTRTKMLSNTFTELQLSTRISSNGVGIGYLAAIIVQILSVFIVQFAGGNTDALKIVLFFIGFWWFVFTLPSAVWLRARPGPPLQMTTFDNRDASKSSLSLMFRYIRYSWHSLYLTCRRARRLRDVLIFLAAWFLLSDGIATISSTAVLFAKTTLHMQPAALALINVVTMLFGVAGAFFWRLTGTLCGLTPVQTILACLAVFELIPLYALMGYLPFVKSWGVLGLQQPWEMYPLAAVYGLVLGGLSSYCRSVYGELVPSGSEAAFFALYAVTDKGSSIFGPAVVGGITDGTGDIRRAFWFLALLIFLPFPILAFVDVDRGKRSGANLAEELLREESS